MSTHPQASLLARFKDQVRDRARSIVAPLVSGLTGMGVRPLGVTIAGLVLSVLAGLSFLAGAFGWGAVLLAASGLCDILDGQLARHQGAVSTLGAFLDSTLDRLGEAAVLIGIAGFYVGEAVRLAERPGSALLAAELGWGARDHAIVAITAVVALTASFLVSYTRARAEGLGIECKVGWFERPERVVVLIVAAAFGVGPWMPTALVGLAALSFVTAAQRVAHVWTKTRAAGGSPPHGAKPD